VRLIMGPWQHGVATVAQSWAGDADFGIDAPEDYDALRLRFFDTALKGLDTGLREEPPVRIFVMGGGTGRRLPSGKLDHGGRWRDEVAWPLERARPTPYYLHGDGTLSPEPPGEDASSTTYRYDPADPVPTVGGNISAAEDVLPAGGFDQRGRPGLIGCGDALPLNARPDVLTFQTPPLERDVEVTGPIGVRVWLSSSAVDTDVTAKLIDVHPPNVDYPDGYALNIGDSILRARYREDRGRPTPMTPGEVYPIDVVLYPTSNVFAAGHRIRLDVSSSNFPRFDVNPNTGEPLGVGGRMVVADNTIHHDAAHPSHVTLPIVPT
jgi:putative CocE/NonD family hydrolase